MIKSTMVLIAVLTMALSAPLARAGEDRAYVGETSVSTSADVGIIVMHELCEADFRRSRMCSSEDIVRNGRARRARAPRVVAWVQSSVVAVTNEPPFVVDKSGFSAVGFSDMSCRAWTTLLGPPFGGLVLTSDLTFSGDLCSAVHPVACCARRRGEKD